MTAQVVAVEELVAYLTDTVEAYAHTPHDDTPYRNTPRTEVTPIH